MFETIGNLLDDTATILHRTVLILMLVENKDHQDKINELMKDVKLLISEVDEANQHEWYRG